MNIFRNITPVRGTKFETINFINAVNRPIGGICSKMVIANWPQIFVVET